MAMLVTKQDIERFVTQTEKKDIDRLRSVAGWNKSKNRTLQQYQALVRALVDALKK